MRLAKLANRHVCQRCISARRLAAVCSINKEFLVMMDVGVVSLEEQSFTALAAKNRNKTVANSG